MKKILFGVEVIDIIGFGSCMIPEYLLKLIALSRLTSTRHDKYGIISASMPGAGWIGGANELAMTDQIAWSIGGYYGAVRNIGFNIAMGYIDGYTLPQGIISYLLTKQNRVIDSTIGIDTLIDPKNRGGALGENPNLTLVESLSEKDGVDGNKLRFSIPNSDLVLIRAAGITSEGRIVLETFPINLDLMNIINAASKRKAKIVVQVPDIVLDDSINSVHRDLFFAVFITKGCFNIDTYRSEYSRYDHSQRLYRNGDDIREIARKLDLRLELNESIITGIGLPVAAINTLNINGELDISIESGNIGGWPIDGVGFGISINPNEVISQNEMFSKIWSGRFDHALLGIGDVDLNGNVYVANLAGQPFGIGGFIDIVSNVKKITFIGRKGKKVIKSPNNEWICYKNNSDIDVDYIYT